MDTTQETAGSTLRLDRPVNVIIPRALREQDAAAYMGLSSSHLRNQRAADARAIKAGKPIKGPRWVTIGTAIRYLREDLDDWLNAHRVDPGQGDPELEVEVSA